MFSTKIFILLACSLAIAVATPLDRGEMTGGPIQLTGEGLEEAQKELQAALTQLAAGDGPNYRISKVISATVQVVSGALAKLDVELVNTDGAIRNCNVSIWSRPWMPNGIETTIECAGQKTLVETHSA